MFVGVSGFEIETLLAEGADSFDDKNRVLHPSLVLPIDMHLSQTCLDDESLTEVAHVKEIQVKAIRTASSTLESVPPATILSKETNLPRLVGVASTNVEFEESLMQLGDLKI